MKMCSKKNRDNYIQATTHKVFSNKQGFTLLEILIALFIFTLLSMMMMGGLHSVIKAQVSTENHAARLRELQLGLLLLSRDVQQTVNRPILNASGQEEAAFIGSPQGFTFTHMGHANEASAIAQSSLQRTRYIYDEQSLRRLNWQVLDFAPSSQPASRTLITNVASLQFTYLDQQGQFHANWPIEGNNTEIIPKAIKMTFILSDWGTLTQLYVIPTQPSLSAQLPSQKP